MKRANTEPYRGVRALFNGDLHLVCPSWAPRGEWVVIDAHTIVYVHQS